MRTPAPQPASRADQAGPVAAACIADFNSTYTFLTRDYSGYRDRMRENAAWIVAVADTVRAAVRTVTTDSACTATIARWTAIFNEHDHHLQFWQQRPAAMPSTESRDARRPSIRFADDSTAVLTLPSFDRANAAAIDSLVTAHRARLLTTPFLVVDVRRNPGVRTPRSGA